MVAPIIADLIGSPPPLLLTVLLWPFIIPLLLLEHYRATRTVVGAQAGTTREAPPPPHPTLSAMALAHKIRSRTLTSRELTEAFIARLKAINAAGLNAVCAESFQASLAVADAADAAVANDSIPDGPEGLLWGVPLVVKECFEVPGMPFTAGIGTRIGCVGDACCPAIARLRGQPILATTNVSEACMFHESANVIYGRTRNPHDLSRTPGGSSGGCAALVAAGCAPLAVTSDVGGSTRIPALYCGLFGHKPTGGTVPNTRTLPKVHPTSLVGRYCQLGPTAQHAVDLWPLLCKIAGPDGADEMVRPTSRDDLLRTSPEDIDVRRLRVIVLEEPFLPWPLRSRLHPELRQAQRSAADALELMGCDVVRWGAHEMHNNLPEASHAFSIWAAMLGSAQPIPFRQLISDGRAMGDELTVYRALLELGRCLWGGGASARHTLPAIGLAIVEEIDASFPSMRAAIKARGERLRERLNALLGGGDAVLLLPSLLTPAPRHHENLLRFPDAAQTGLFNVMELPATAVPLGTGSGRLPLGCQVVAGFGHDQVSLAVAIALEREGVARSVVKRGPL